MTFLEALQWMSENEDNVAYRVVQNDVIEKYKVKNGELLYEDVYGDWKLSVLDVYVMMEPVWSKSEPAPKEVEIVAYLSNNGYLALAAKGTEAEEYSKGWRKVKVRFS